MAQEQDYVWFYIVGLVLLVAGVVFMVKGSEHDQFATTAKAIAEDANNSAYKHSLP